MPENLHIDVYPPFRRRKDADARIASARKAIAIILEAEDVLAIHRRELLTICLWKITEAEGTSKYKTRFRSQASFGLPASELQHEHVHQRRNLVRRLIDDPSSIDEVVRDAIGCTVTRTEHRALTAISRSQPTLDGWDRYAAAGIIVVDCSTGSIFLPSTSTPSHRKG